MITLKLEGMFSFIDSYDRLRFSFLDDVDPDDKSRQKLKEHCGTGNIPYDKEGFIVVLPKTIRKDEIPPDITELVGRRCSIVVRVTAYSFPSKFKQNEGAQVNGMKLVLDSIEPARRNTIAGPVG